MLVCAIYGCNYIPREAEDDWAIKLGSVSSPKDKYVIRLYEGLWFFFYIFGSHILKIFVELGVTQEKYYLS